MSAHPFYFSGDPYLSVMKGVYQALCTPEPFVKLTGAAHTGKTSLCEKLTLFMRKKGRRVIFFDCVIQSPEELRLVLIKELRLPERHNFSRQVEQLLPSSDEERVTIIFDNVDQYSITTLLDVARLAEIQGDSRRVLNIVICGDVSLNQRLSSNADFLSLKQQISHSFTLSPMRSDALSAFYMDYFSKADMEEVHLEPQALALAFRATGGLPGAAAQIGKAIAESRVGMQELTAVSRLELIGFLKNLSMDSGLRANASALLEGQGRVYLPVFAVLILLTIAFILSRGFEAEEGLPGSNGVSTAVGQADGTINSGDIAIITVDEEAALENDLSAATNLQTSARSSPFADENNAEETTDVLQVSPPILLPEEAAVPVSDSSLSLVTAAERGIDADQLVTPVFEDFIAEERDSLTASIAPLLESDTAPGATEENAATAVLEPAEITQTIETTEREISNVITRVDEVLDSEPQGDTASNADPEPETPALEQQDSAATDPEVAEVETQLVIEQPLDAGEISPLNSPAVEEPAPIAQQPEEVEPEYLPRDFIDLWVAAWETQNVEGYLEAYHPEFRPRYFDSRNEWRRTRERNIARPEWIRLALSDVEVTESSESEAELVFWLGYESPTYRDRTRKRVVLTELEGRWLISEEVNLEVRKE